MSDPSTDPTDAADLLRIAETNRAAVAARLRAGLPEFLVVLAAWCLGRLFAFDDLSGFALVATIVGAVVWPLDALASLRGRRQLGAGFSRTTWVVAGLVLVATATAALAVGGAAEATVIGIPLGVGFLAVGAASQYALSLVLGTIILVGLATDALSAWVQIPILVVVLCLGVVLGRDQFLDTRSA